MLLKQTDKVKVEVAVEAAVEVVVEAAATLITNLQVK